MGTFGNASTNNVYGRDRERVSVWLVRNLCGSVTKFSQVGPPQSEPHQPTNMMISEKETVLQVLDWAGLISWAELEKAGHGHGGYGGMRVPRPEISDDGPGSLYVAASGPAWTSHYH